MSWYRKNPLFATGLTLCAVVALGEVALTYERWAASREAAKRLEQRKADLQGMAALTPPPTRPVAGAIEADLERARKALASMQGELKGRGAAGERLRTAKVPAARTDSYFDLATYVEKLRELAANHEVEIRTEAARFGFAAYANEGPLQDHIEPVFRQRLVAQYLLESLLEARPRALLAVKREPTLSKADREARATALANGEVPPDLTADAGSESPDYFVIDPRVTARAPGYIDTIPFRIVFTGQTAALRSFLNRLASFELPILVREVEVQPATAEESAVQATSDEAVPGDSGVAAAPASENAVPAPVAAKPAPATRATRAPIATPIVANTLSKFTVTVEFVELVPTAAPAGDAAAGTPTP
jgi:hypothetical protein